jgi:glycosyltransferase involved in cell wall biosynthesis
MISDYAMPSRDVDDLPVSVSVLIPVYNGADFLELAIQSVMDQTLQDLELVICDNASTDATRSIAERYAGMDSRIRYVRHATNTGVNRNWDFAARQARGKYLKWLSSSDYMAPDLLSVCVGKLENAPRAVLCFPETMWVDVNGYERGVVEQDFSVQGDDLVDRFLQVASRLCVNSPINAGVFRRDAVISVLPLGNYPGADLVAMARLAVIGEFLLVADTRFFRRSGAQYSTLHRSARETGRLFNSNATLAIQLIETRRLLGYYSAIHGASLPLSDRVRLACAATKNIWWSRRLVINELATWRRKPQPN